MNTDDLLRLCRERMQDAIDGDRENREEALDDFENLTGHGQWPDDVRRDREADSRPCLTINRLPQFVRQVTGDIRRMNPAINVMPADGEANEETAEIIEGLVRQIQADSDAASVYEWAGECAAACSIGWFRVVTDWVDDTGFEQEIRLKAIRNPLSVYFDPMAEDPTKADGEYVFITAEMKRADFERAYPGKVAVDADRDSAIEGISNWYNRDTVVVAEYYYKEPVTRTLGLLADGRVVDDPPAAAYVVRTRKVQSHKVMWCKVSGKDVLEGPIEQPTRFIPVVCVPGEEWAVGDRTYRSSVIRFAKDPQRLYNYWRSAQTELVALQPKAPFLVTATQVAGYETFWNEANNSNRPYLPYNPDTKAANPPQRATPPVASSGMMQEVLTAAEDMKATTGVYDAALGNDGNEKSGVAIRQRQMEADVSTSIYSDNMAKAVEHAGRIIVEMIPKIYDTARVLRILGKDDTEQMVPVNGVMVTQDGPMPVNDLTRGKYAVRIAVGPNYSTMRQESAESMLEFVRVFPGAAQVVGDLIAKNMDWPGADQFAERLKKLLPPGVAEDEDGQDGQMMMLQEQIQQLTEMLQGPEFRKAMAEAEEAEAGAVEAAHDAEKAGFETMQKQLELAAQSGQLDAAIQNAVARALQGAMAPQGAF